MDRAAKIHQYLILEDFGAYMERYAEFAVLPSSPEIFAKEMKLMETDDQYTHRQKETLRAKGLTPLELRELRSQVQI